MEPRGHAHVPVARERRHRPLVVVLLATAAFMLAEAAAGFAANSLALLSDAGHMLTDVGALALSLFAFRLAERPPDAARTYGYYRAEILAAFLNGIVLVLIALAIGWNAWRRFERPPEVRGGVVFAFGLLGLAVNVAGAAYLSRMGRNLNLRGAFMNMAADALGSLAALVAGALILWRGWFVADAVASAAVALLILLGAWSLIRQSVHVLLEGAPARLSLNQVRQDLLRLEGVESVHDLHVWSLTTGVESLSAHLCTSAGVSPHDVVSQAQAFLRRAYGIEHVTIQVEPPGVACPEIHA